MTMTAPSRPRAAALPRDVAMRLAATEYQRFGEMLRALRPGDWAKPTQCPGWDVRAMAAHALAWWRWPPRSGRTTGSSSWRAAAAGCSSTR